MRIVIGTGTCQDGAVFLRELGISTSANVGCNVKGCSGTSRTPQARPTCSKCGLTLQQLPVYNEDYRNCCENHVNTVQPWSMIEGWPRVIYGPTHSCALCGRSRKLRMLA